MLSHRRQVARMRHLAVQALGAYPLADPQLRFVAHGENTTFRVDAMAPDGPARFLLRVHRPARHGRNADTAAAVGSELDWLAALRADTDLAVPEPFRTIEGNLTTAAASRDVPQPRVCSVLRWMDGRVRAAAPRPVHLRRLGSVMARLHDHAGQWRPPPGFVRIRWDWETFFGDTMVYGGLNAADVWDLLPDDLRRRFDRVAARMKHVMTELGSAADSVGLIHADLHLDNALFWHGDVRVIDFDDCGFGYWLYDIAVALWELRHRHDYEQFRDALIEGYTRHRPPPRDLALLDDFIATRDVAFGLWFAGTAQANPAFRADLDEVLQNIGRSAGRLDRVEWLRKNHGLMVCGSGAFRMATRSCRHACGSTYPRGRMRRPSRQLGRAGRAVWPDEQRPPAELIRQMRTERLIWVFALISSTSSRHRDVAWIDDPNPSRCGVSG